MLMQNFGMTNKEYYGMLWYFLGWSIVSVSVLSKVLSLAKLSCPVIWNIEQEKDREKERVGGRPAKLNEKKGDRDLELEIKNKGDIILVGRTTGKVCSGGDKMRNASGHQCKVKMSGSEGEHVRHFLHKTCN